VKSRTLILSVNASWNVVNFRSGLVRGLAAAGYRIVALTPTDSFSPRLAALGVEHVPLEMDTRGKSPLRDLLLLWRYYRLLGRIRPAAYLGFTIKPNIYGTIAARMRGIPVVNNIAGLGETFIGRSWINRLVRILYRFALRRSGIVFFQNRDDRALFVSNGIVAEPKARLLPGSGIDLERFRPPSAPPQRDGFVFLLVARLLWAKGIREYVEAARIVRRSVPDARFRLLGLVQEGPAAVDEPSLRAWQEEGAIEFLGGTDDVRPFLADADCVVLPTFYPEGTPRGLLEAAAMARPLIATDVPGCREIVRAGENGYLVPPKDAEALARRMLDLIALPAAERAALGARSRSIAETEYDERLVVDRYLAAVEAVAGRG
jgi:glycosyltransferase involved in cell wall biosynthesis